jgi:hypothetical protein
MSSGHYCDGCAQAYYKCVCGKTNGRIKELAEQAGGYVSLSHEHDGKLILSGEDIVQKFAELIVRECASIAGKAEYSDTWFVPVEETIKQHFGVKA